MRRESTVHKSVIKQIDGEAKFFCTECHDMNHTFFTSPILPQVGRPRQFGGEVVQSPGVEVAVGVLGGHGLCAVLEVSAGAPPPHGVVEAAVDGRLRAVTGRPQEPHQQPVEEVVEHLQGSMYSCMS